MARPSIDARRRLRLGGRACGQREVHSKIGDAAFYEAIAKSLEKAEHILVVGAGTGASGAMDRLVAELGEHHPGVAKKIVRTIVIDETHLSQDQLLQSPPGLF